MSQQNSVWRIALPTRLNRLFDYLPIDGLAPDVGVRVKVPFGPRKLVGVLIETTADSSVPREKLKAALEVLDQSPILPAELVAIAQWAHRYYHYPLGDILSTMLPKLLRQGQMPVLEDSIVYCVVAGREVTDQDINKLAKKSAIQAQLLAWLKECPAGVSQAALRVAGFQSRSIKSLLDKGWIEEATRAACQSRPEGAIKPSPITLNAQQDRAVTAILAAQGFETFLLDGVTGSGKTEVYLRVMAALLSQGKQVLVLVPEIGLTPQTLSRFQQRFAVPMAVIHSALSDHERAQAWLQAKSGHAALVIGTRSAVFTPMPQLGAIILDEEHDGSFRQQTQFRYSARDLALVRAQKANVPVVLGSATPSLHTRYNAEQGRYQWLRLTERAGGAAFPQAMLLDVRGQLMRHGISGQLHQAITQHLANGHQVLLFLNRRGYAPVLMCHECGWSAECPQCDVKFTLHLNPRRLACHHCDLVRPIPEVCPDCDHGELVHVGLGTERIEETLIELFPDVPVVRVDRDSVKGRDQLSEILASIHSGQAQILLGTQMLAKGHHFPKVTLVGIIDADQSLYSADFRAAEHLAQTILQVSGRAGRAEVPGSVLIQTHHPQHPLLLELLRGGYDAFAKRALIERQSTALPPYAYMALLRAEATLADCPEAFLQLVSGYLQQYPVEAVAIYGPIPAMMPRKAGRFRAQLMIQSADRQALHQALSRIVSYCEASPEARKVKWALEVDP